MRRLFFVFALLLQPSGIQAAGCDNYCVGIRGNGESVPAHWGALSRMVEENGMPKATAGGSSATITMFFLDSLQGNEKVKAEQDAERKRKIQALMIKSMPEFTAAMTQDAKIVDAMAMLQAYKGGDPELRKKAMEAFGGAGSMSPSELQKTFEKYGALVNPELLALVAKNPAKFGPEAQKSIQNLGAFNAVTDDTIFFRPGLVDFRGAAVVLDHMADFYAGNTDPETKAAFDAYLDECAEKAFQKEWNEVGGGCKEKFRKIAGDYLKAGKFQYKALFNKVGTNMDALPTTSVIQGQGLASYMAMKKKYEAGTATPEELSNFAVNFERDMRSGYWGKPELIERTSRGLEPFREQGDLKAKSFKGLGQGNWFEVIATSPAEPGIANAQPIPVNTTREQVIGELRKPITKRWQGLEYSKTAMSTGGWSDLHPTQVLKAQGCSPVVYLTRQAKYGDSKFGQQIFIRLTGTKKEIPFWDHIGDASPPGWCPDRIKAENGADVAKVMATPWARISNTCNPQSSFRRALEAADAVHCTNWDNDEHDIFKGNLRAAIRDAYEAPTIPSSAAGKGCQLNRQPSTTDPRGLHGCIPYRSGNDNGGGGRDSGGTTGAQ